MAGRRRKNETVWAQAMASAAVLVRTATGKAPRPRHAAQAEKATTR